ncbi:unnamed protein product [Phytophthora fragariaefolia]|uniref:Unnamed protein product n=1 Tax=Phytophthora fragariaefolia TaxID=1490495 RepID=A0A9W6Y3R6_9STRA|nr:unnamed protein product [Phytophthora fragariaefolia]
MEELPGAWDTSVNVVLDGDIFASENDFEKFMESLTPVCSATALGPQVGTKRVQFSSAIQKPKRCRKSPKQEIDHLRAVATELEKKLRELHHAHTESSASSNPFWRRVSKRLLEQRQQSAVENARLRCLVRTQLATLKTLQRSLDTNPALSQNDIFPEGVQRAVVPSQPKDIYQDLFRNLSALYSTGVDTMLPLSSAPSPSLGGSKKVNIEIETDCNDSLRMCLQVVENKVVPVCFKKIRGEAWGNLTGTNGHEDFEQVRGIFSG